MAFFRVAGAWDHRAAWSYAVKPARSIRTWLPRTERESENEAIAPLSKTVWAHCTTSVEIMFSVSSWNMQWYTYVPATGNVIV